MNIINSLLSGVYVPALLSYLLRSRVPQLKATTTFDHEYDYIIVGSGPGGSVVANRLSQNSQIKVLLLEVGTTDNVTTELPAATIVLQNDRYDWNYKSVPQKESCKDKIGQISPLHSGKVIGGSSTINLMIHTRGNKIDFDEWSENGNPGWSYEEVLPYFKKYEHYLTNGTCVEDKYHGCNGELTISQLMPGVAANITNNVVSEFQKFGYDVIDFNGLEETGVTHGYYTMKNGARVSAATAFLRPVQQRKNLHIVLEAFVHKVLIDSDKKSVMGVEFEKDGKINRIKAKKEVILSAGVYSSPKILMLSGIGPKQELEKFKIPVNVDLPGVGQHLQESIAVTLPISKEKEVSPDLLNMLSIQQLKLWQRGKSSIASTPGGLEAYAHVRTKYENKTRPDLMLTILSLPFLDLINPYLKRGIRITDQYWNLVFGPLINKDGFSIFPTLLRPQSKGKVTLKSSDPKDEPIIDPNYLAEEIDRKRLLEGTRIVQQYLNASRFPREGYTLRIPSFDECKQYEVNSDEHIMCSIRYLITDIRSACCTNRMGPNTDKMAVVDHRLKVKGIKGLRVVDASVFHTQVSGLAGANVYMVAEKAAAMIQEDNK